MQRWIAIIGVVLVLAFGGGAFAFNQIRQKRPAPMWVPLPLNPGMPDDKRESLVTEVKSKISTDEVLTQVSKDLGLASKLDVADDAAAVAILRQRLFVEIGETPATIGNVPSLNVGVTGIRRDRALSGEIATRLMQEVWRLFNIKPPE